MHDVGALSSLSTRASESTEWGFENRTYWKGLTASC